MATKEQGLLAVHLFTIKFQSLLSMLMRGAQVAIRPFQRPSGVMRLQQSPPIVTNSRNNEKLIGKPARSRYISRGEPDKVRSPHCSKKIRNLPDFTRKLLSTPGNVSDIRRRRCHSRHQGGAKRDEKTQLLLGVDFACRRHFQKLQPPAQVMDRL